MNTLLTLSLQYQDDVVISRQRTRQIAQYIGFSMLDQTRIATAVSEISRNVILYAGKGKVEFYIDRKKEGAFLFIRISDNGPGIQHIESTLTGKHKSKSGMGIGIPGSKKIMDYFDIRTAKNAGTIVTMGKKLPKGVSISTIDIKELQKSIKEAGPVNPFDEIKTQNQELIGILENLINQKKELEDTNRAILALYAELHEKTHEIDMANKMKSEFISYISHEIRVPLNSILLISRTLLEEASYRLSEDDKKHVKMIMDTCKNLIELANGLLDLRKIEAGKMEVVPVVFDIDILYSTLRGLLSPLTKNTEVKLNFLKKGKMPRMFTDLNKLTQILRNLISNALKFTFKGTVTVMAEHSDNYITFTVKDTGVGIKREDQDNIFKEYMQAPGNLRKDVSKTMDVETENQSIKGVGLGLSIAKKLAGLLKGELFLEKSIPEKGSVFKLRIPIKYPV